ncbi:GNAT family N-acetyltransferase [Legionella waltersii]|uniref:GNAT family acetyltransferase n=1 Tax=Legionella waltersii TaxID=66969 RepID=A0A0W1A7P0_9GAMM|nr:GNAT family N-acetyltransferase [Legionella waltersii]KTD77184.1 GNAT family acetyltransferase [Legionella waltersii]SNV11319.1 GNAT family acetyltransferase [Legionella waltersii]
MISNTDYQTIIVIKEQIHFFHELENYFFSLVSSNTIDYGTMKLYETGVLTSGLNVVFVNQIEDDFSIKLNQCKDYFGQRKLPWSLVIPEHAQRYSKQDKVLEQEYELSGIGVGMGMKSIPSELIVPETPLHFKEMSDDLQAWSVPLIYGFESTPEVTAVYTQRHHEAMVKCAGIYHFSGFLDGEVVVSMTLTVQGAYARIDDVATLPAFQRRGFASAMIVYALRKAIELNVKTCFLEASDDGLNIYKRIGFQPLFMNYYYGLKA